MVVVVNVLLVKMGDWWSKNFEYFWKQWWNFQNIFFFLNSHDEILDVNKLPNIPPTSTSCDLSLSTDSPTFGVLSHFYSKQRSRTSSGNLPPRIFLFFLFFRFFFFSSETLSLLYSRSNVLRHFSERNTLCCAHVTRCVSFCMLGKMYHL